MRRFLWQLTVILGVIGVFLFSNIAGAAEKNWSAGGDGSTWSDDDNWFAASEPTTADDVLIDVENASVACTQTFKAKSITIGGRTTSSTLTSNNFVFGTISPGSRSDIAVLVRRGGKFTLKGAGTVTLQGQYKDSTAGASLTSEPSFMFWME